MTHKPHHRTEWRPLPKLIAYLVMAAVLITVFTQITTGPNAVLFSLTIPALIWIGYEMRRKNKDR